MYFLSVDVIASLDNISKFLIHRSGHAAKAKAKAAPMGMLPRLRQPLMGKKHAAKATPSWACYQGQGMQPRQPPWARSQDQGMQARARQPMTPI
nr:hypothetical protein CFP56_51746 [Quercus suber]